MQWALHPGRERDMIVTSLYRIPGNWCAENIMSESDFRLLNSEFQLRCFWRHVCLMAVRGLLVVSSESQKTSFPNLSSHSHLRHSFSDNDSACISCPDAASFLMQKSIFLSHSLCTGSPLTNHTSRRRRSLISAGNGMKKRAGQNWQQKDCVIFRQMCSPSQTT